MNTSFRFRLCTGLNPGIAVMYLCFLFFNGCRSNEQASSGTSASDTTSFYSEKHRPQLHFSPQANWMNDPNGMVYHNGNYHLFYQYYPDGMVWGPMHWGHAISKDLVSWKHLPIALYPDSLGLIFSGSAVVDEENTSGFGSPDNPPLVAIFTYHSVDKERQAARITRIRESPIALTAARPGRNMKITRS